MKQTVLPRWRGFNLLGGFVMSSPGEFEEDQFRYISDWGFDFVRLPLNYTFWIDEDDPFKINENKLAFVDEAVNWGQRYGLHVELNLHRAPGFSVAEDRMEPFSLWDEREAEEAFRLHWLTLARRYKGIHGDKLSFNLINEPHDISEDVHNRVLLPTIGAIQEIDRERLIILDGMDWGTVPNESILAQTEGVKLAQSCRSYAPHPFTHYLAEWSNPDYDQPEPSWPFQHYKNANDRWDRESMFEWFGAWAEFAVEHNIGVHCGEGGAHNRTPHPAVLAWMEDCLDALKTYNIGYALWNLSGSFGILDSGRKDVQYEDYYGHQLDRKMLDLLKKY